ncbi:MerR family transcriptional regulator [Bacillus toyonensis]|uniref:MerR family transcriptional regulator n=1 Tax=Bacillus toyonensis TaxID=155322 RepID=UPI00211D9BDD|nr:MerR family transcriptional regulator [Bacillus toyonensis]
MDSYKLTKSDVIKIFNTTKETLRFYEEKGLVQPKVGKNNYRLYGNEDLQKISQIFFCKDIGFSIEEIDLVINKRNIINNINILQNKKMILKLKFIDLWKCKRKLLGSSISFKIEVEASIKFRVSILRKENIITSKEKTLIV